MSELSVKVAAEHTFFPIAGCFCRKWRGSERGHAAHVAEVTEAAVRETIAADIEAMPLGTAIHRVSGRTMAHAVRTEAARIARGET